MYKLFLILNGMLCFDHRGSDPDCSPDLNQEPATLFPSYSNKKSKLPSDSIYKIFFAKLGYTKRKLTLIKGK